MMNFITHHVAKYFSHNAGKIVISLGKDKIPVKDVDREYKSEFNTRSFKKLLEMNGEVLNIENINIDNEKAIEAIWTQTKTGMDEKVYYTKFLSNFIYHKGYFILLIHGTSGHDKSEVHETFSTLLSDFREMAQASEFLN